MLAKYQSRQNSVKNVGSGIRKSRVQIPLSKLINFVTLGRLLTPELLLPNHTILFAVPLCVGCQELLYEI